MDLHSLTLSRSVDLPAGQGREDDWFTPSKQYDRESGPADVYRTPSSARRTESSPGKRMGRTASAARSAATSKGGFADLTNTEIGQKELGMTMDVLESEMRSLNKQNEDLNDEIFKMHIALLKLGDPSEAPFSRTQLIKDVWVVEGHEGVGEPGIEFACKPEHGVQVLNCNGGGTLTPITVTGVVKWLEMENCSHVRLVVEAVLFGITLTNCQDVLLVVGGELPDVEVKNCTAAAFLICHKMIDGKFRCVNSGGLMVSTVDRGTNPVMLPEQILEAGNLVSAEVPAYFVTTSSYRTWTSQVTAHPTVE